MTDKLRVWLISTNRIDAIYRYGKLFEKIEAELQVHIELKILTWHTAFEDMLDAFEVGEEPDILEVGYTWIASFYENGLLDTVPKSLDRAKPIAPWLDNYATYDDGLYGLPFFIEPYILLANKKNLNKYYGKLNKLKDFTHFKQVCNKIEKVALKKHNQEMNAFSIAPRIELGTVLFFLSWLQKNGYRYPEITDKTNAFFDTQLFSDTFKYLCEIMDSKDLETKDGHFLAAKVHKDFMEEDKGVFILSNGEEIISDTLEAIKDGARVSKKYEAFAIPNNSKDATTFSGGGFLCVSKFSEKKEEAWAVINKLLTDEFMEQWCIDTGNVPACEGAFWDKYGQYDLFKMIKDEAQRTINFPIDSIWRGIEYILMDGFLNLVQDYWIEKKPFDEFYVKASIETMNREIHQLILKEKNV